MSIMTVVQFLRILIIMNSKFRYVQPNGLENK